MIEWLKAAFDDIILLDNIIDNKHITNLIAFHSQQVVEKSIKALFEHQNKKIPKVHKIQTLIDMIGIDLDLDEDVAHSLDELYIESRYPGDMGLLPYGKPTLVDAREFYDFAKGVFEKICDVLGVDKQEISNH